MSATRLVSYSFKARHQQSNNKYPFKVLKLLYRRVVLNNSFVDEWHRAVSLKVGSRGQSHVNKFCMFVDETYVIIMSGEEASGGDKPNFAGKYVLVRNENFDEFLAANGITLCYCSLVGLGSY